MSWITKLLAVGPDTTRGRFLLLIADKLIIGLIIVGAISFFQILQSDREATRTERVANAQISVERARLQKDILPFILRDSTDVVASGYLLSSSLSAGLFDKEVAIEIISGLYARGLPDAHAIRIARLALPAGLPAVARQAARLRHEMNDQGKPALSATVRAVQARRGHYAYVPSENLSASLQEVVRERLLWADILRKFVPRMSVDDERRIFSKEFLTEFLVDILFLLQTVRMTDTRDLFLSTSDTLRLIGALDSVSRNWGPKKRASDYLGSILSSLDLRSIEDLSFALAIIEILENHAYDKRGDTTIATGIAVHLARFVVDESFLHRISWIPNNASEVERDKYWAEDKIADVHSSLQLRAGNVLVLMKKSAIEAEDILVSFVNDFMINLKHAEAPDDVALMRSRYGKYSVRFTVEVLKALDTKKSREIIDGLRNLDSSKLRAFEGLVGVLQSRTRN